MLVMSTTTAQTHSPSYGSVLSAQGSPTGTGRGNRQEGTLRTFYDGKVP